MKRFFVATLLALTVAGLAGAFPPGIGDGDKHLRRVRGHWMQPTTGAVYDYSAYFAARYPQMPGADEFQYQNQGAYGRAYPIGRSGYGAQGQRVGTSEPALAPGAGYPVQGPVAPGISYGPAQPLPATPSR